MRVQPIEHRLVTMGIGYKCFYRSLGHRTCSPRKSKSELIDQRHAFLANLFEAHLIFARGRLVSATQSHHGLLPFTLEARALVRRPKHDRTREKIR
jgi:hypothetical protein